MSSLLKGSAPLSVALWEQAGGPWQRLRSKSVTGGHLELITPDKLGISPCDSPVVIQNIFYSETKIYDGGVGYKFCVNS